MCFLFFFFFPISKNEQKRRKEKKKRGVVDNNNGHKERAWIARKKERKKKLEKAKQKKKVVPLHMSVALRFRVSLGTTMPPVDPGGGGGMREAAPREGDLADSPPSGAILGMPEVPSF